jgi:hypothetical protein
VTRLLAAPGSRRTSGARSWCSSCRPGSQGARSRRARCSSPASRSALPVLACRSDHFGTTPQPDAFPSYAWDFPGRDPQLTTGASGQPPRPAGQNPRREFSAARARRRVRALRLAVARRRLNGGGRRRLSTRSGVSEIEAYLGIGSGRDRRSWRILASRSGGGGGRQAAGAALLARRARERGPRLFSLGSPPSRGAAGGRRLPSHSNQR